MTLLPSACHSRTSRSTGASWSRKRFLVLLGEDHPRCSCMVVPFKCFSFLFLVPCWWTCLCFYVVACFAFCLSFSTSLAGWLTLFRTFLAEHPEAKMLGRAALLIKKAATSQDPSKGKGRKAKAGRGGKVVTPQKTSGEAQTSLVMEKSPAKKPSEPMVVSSSSSEGEGLVFPKKATGVSKRPGGEAEGDKRKRLRHSSPGGDGDLRAARSPLQTTPSQHQQTQPQPRQQQQQQQRQQQQ